MPTPSAPPTEKCLKRLQKEISENMRNPPEDILIAPSSSNILDWYFCFDGPADTPFAKGEFVARILFPSTYPFAPPSIFFTTPNGRFEVNTRICMTMSDYHPESWSPVWNALTIARGCVSFMVEVNSPAAGAVQATEAQRKRFAAESRAWNRMYCPAYMELFAEKRDAIERARAAKAAAPADQPAPPATTEQKPKAADEPAAPVRALSGRKGSAGAAAVAAAAVEPLKRGGSRRKRDEDA